MDEVSHELEIQMNEGTMDDWQAARIKDLAYELAGDDQMLDWEEFLNAS